MQTSSILGIRQILIHTPSMGRNQVGRRLPYRLDLTILIHTPSVGRNRRICDIRTYSAPCFIYYTNRRQRLAYSQLHGIYITNNSCERYGGFMCVLRSHNTIHLPIGDPPFFIYSIPHCILSPFFTDESGRTQIIRFTSFLVFIFVHLSAVTVHEIVAYDRTARLP